MPSERRSPTGSRRNSAAVSSCCPTRWKAILSPRFTAGTRGVLKIPRHVRGRDELEQLHGEVFVRVGLRLGGCARVHHDAHDFFPQPLLVPENLDGVAVALAHLLPVETGHRGDFVAN